MPSGVEEDRPATWPPPNGGWAYALAAVTVAVCTAVAWAISPYFRPTNLVMVFLAGTVALATRARPVDHRGHSQCAGVRRDLHLDLPLIPVDGLLVQQVLVNLLENAPSTRGPAVFRFALPITPRPPCPDGPARRRRRPPEILLVIEALLASSLSLHENDVRTDRGG
jgi:hypothetical protein